MARRTAIALFVAVLALASRPALAEPRRDVIVAIDVGGQGVKYRLYDEAGRALSRAGRIATPPRATPLQIEKIVSVIHARARKKLGAERSIAGVVVGFPGPVIRGRVVAAGKFDAEAWRNGGDGWQLERRLTDALGTRVVVGTDLGVATHGLAPATGRTLLVGLGTGVGVTVASYRGGRLRIESPWETHPEEMTALEAYAGESARRAAGTAAWSEAVLVRALPTLRGWTRPDRVILFGGNAEHLRKNPVARRRLRAAGIEILRDARFANLRGAVPFWRSRTGARRSTTGDSAPWRAHAARAVRGRPAAGRR